MSVGLGKSTGRLPFSWEDVGGSGFILLLAQPDKTSRPRVEKVRRRMPCFSE